MIYQLDTIFNFGKHKGKSLEELLLLQTGQGYILWYFGVNPDFYFSQETVQLFSEKFPEKQISPAIKEIIEKRANFYNDQEEEDDADDDDSYSIYDSYFDGGGGDEWSDPTEFWG